MNFEIIYSPAAVSDLDRVWDEVYEASRSFDIADRYITDGIMLLFANVSTMLET